MINVLDLLYAYLQHVAPDLFVDHHIYYNCLSHCQYSNSTNIIIALLSLANRKVNIKMNNDNNMNVFIR